MDQNPPGLMTKKKLLVFSHETLPFIKQDEWILKKHFDVKVFTSKSYTTIPTALTMYGKVLLWLIRNIRQCDGMFLTFADVYGFFFSVFARLFKKKLFVVVGGFDATWIPELNYGTYNNKRSRFFTWFTFKTATKILPVSKSLAYGDSNNFGLKTRKQGIKILFPDIDNNKIIVVPNGYRPNHFKANEQIKKDNKVIMAASIKTYQRFKIKGGDAFIKIASVMPDLTFTMIGAETKILKQWIEIPKNLKTIAYVPQEELIMHYQSAKIFMCPSLTEGMPNVLSEAMLCECVPIGFNISSIPEIIGDTGIVIDGMDMEKIKSAVNMALKMDGRKARKRIIDRFPIEAREKTLAQIIESELSS